ncbi:MAG: Acyl-protein synthetase [Myxococcaceae bacterium]|nr:Acyl-protein synthetase [Myxococcaceae bacterium]
MIAARSSLHSRILSLIARLAHGTRDDQARDALLLELAAYQREHVAPYARFSSQRLRTRGITDIVSVDQVPALPTDAFRHARISSRPESEDLRTFRSSGTTQDTRSLHTLQDLSLYDAAAQAAARFALFPDLARMPLIILAPHERELSDSSLSYMLARFVEWFGNDASTHVWPLDQLELTRLRARLHAAAHANMPVALLGTSFAFVHAVDALGGEHFELPAKSRIMQTGGFKGRSREVSPEAMRQLLTDSFGTQASNIVAEYGMTELSSQLYDNTLRAEVLGEPAPARRLWTPGWVRTSIVDPETLTPLPHGEEGLVRIDDLANLDSVAFIQTSDLGVADELGIVLHGRAPLSVARGCSITADELLSTKPR